jgi:hypothetical protein
MEEDKDSPMGKFKDDMPFKVSLTFLQTRAWASSFSEQILKSAICEPIFKIE